MIMVHKVASGGGGGGMEFWVVRGLKIGQRRYYVVMSEHTVWKNYVVYKQRQNGGKYGDVGVEMN